VLEGTFVVAGEIDDNHDGIQVLKTVVVGETPDSMTLPKMITVSGEYKNSKTGNRSQF